ncbi:adenosine deaminase [Nesterenkonia muleiensis]|uniref:adenosine deaminase n=1 Tax=Nesterenkonia muleiensis TaxID=2282648 RepID=UPI000E7113C3|nr:adenosine deaminase [Nesterenkonia muleiensis]
MRDPRTLPKGHLHLHLEAAMRSATLDELAGRMGIELPQTEGFEGFTAFSQMYRGLLAVLQEPVNLRRLIHESVQDAAQQGAVYLELGVSPAFYVEVYGSLQESLDAMLSYSAEASEEHGVEVGFMVTADRQQPVEEATALAKVAAARADRGVVSFGLANEERGNPCAAFQRPFAIAKSAGLQSTPHAGELVGPESVWEAIDVLGADRVLHGVTSASDPKLIDAIVARGVCLDVCPTSNLLLNVVESLAEHPLKMLLDAGVRCSINADDPILFGPDLLEEYELCRSALGLSDAELAACALSSVECTLASEETKSGARRGIEQWLAEPSL